jgi:hypothetical protein
MHRLLYIVGLSLLLAAPAALADSVVVEVVAATGTQVPGEPAGVTHEIDTSSSAWLYATMNHGGDIAFVTDLAGPGLVKLANDQALFFRALDGTVTKAAQRGSPAPGAPEGATWLSFKLGGLAADGTIGFRAELDHLVGGGGVTQLNDKALYSWKSGAGHTLEAREGSPAPGAEQYLLWPFTGWFIPAAMVPHVTATGKLAFKYPLVIDGEAQESLFGTNGEGDLYPVAYAGMAVPGLPGGELYSGLGNGMAINDAGQLVFRATLKQGPGGEKVSTANDTVMVGPGPGGALTVLAREGGDVPGVPGAVWTNVQNLDQFSIANDGRVAWSELLTKEGKNYDSVVQSTASGSLEVVAMAGDPAPGFAEVGGTFKTFSHVARASNGSLGWMSEVDIPDDSIRGLFWRSPEGAAEMVMRQGDPIPGMDGALFGWPDNLVYLNSSGQMLFSATAYILEPFASMQVLFLFTPGEGVQRLLAGGDKITVAPGDVRTVQYAKLPEVHPAGGADADGRILPLTNAGVVLVSVAFVEPSADPTHTLNVGVLRIQVIDGDPCDNIDCEDDNACTQDTCDPQSGCQHAPKSCDDGDPCTDDTCTPQAGCSHAAKTCIDDDPCTTDECNGEGQCQFFPVSCDDGNACTTDTCSAQAGCLYTAVTCDDSDPCTADICDVEDGTCKHLALPAGNRCAGDDWVRVDVCDQVLEVLASCVNGCADDGCCPDGSWADGGNCVSEPLPDAEPDVVTAEDSWAEVVEDEINEPGMDAVADIVEPQVDAGIEVSEPWMDAGAEVLTPGLDARLEADQHGGPRDSHEMGSKADENGPGGGARSGGCSTSQKPGNWLWLLLSLLVLRGCRALPLRSRRLKF